MIRPTVRSAGLVLLLSMNGCGTIMSSSTGARTPGLSVAEAALEGGSGQIALQVSDGVLRGSPDNIRALEIKGDALTLLGDYDQAGEIFQALLTKEPNSVRAGIGLGRVKLAKDPAAAELLFMQVLQHDPKHVTALNNLGIARDLQGHHAQAQPAYREALAINPDLESAQVNLALSMAMSGQGPAAVKLLQAKATQPGAPAKVKHDYAVVLAMAGNRAGAERVLSDDMPPDEARQLLDSATGTSTKVKPGNDAFASAQRDDDVPPDVVQVPETAAAPLGAGKTTHAMAAAAAASPPMVVRPRALAEPDSDTPRVQPVNPVAAAVTNQQPLALPIHATPANPAPVRRVAETTSDAAAVTPEVVAVPPALPAPRPAAGHDATANGGQALSSDAPLPQPSPQPAPVPPAVHPVAAAAHAETSAPPAYHPVAAATHAEVPVPPAYHPVAAAGHAEVAVPPANHPVTVAAHVEVPVPSAVHPVPAAQHAEVPVPSAIHPVPAAQHAEVAVLPAATPAQAVVSHPDVARVATHSGIGQGGRNSAHGAPIAPPTTVLASAAVAPALAAPRAMAAVGPHAAIARSSNVATGIGRPRSGATEEATPTVQFAAATSQQAAHSFWQVLVHRFPDALGRREPVVIRFEHGGTVFWRVRAEGFGSLLEAQTLCARMRAGGQACFVPRS